MIQHMGSSLQRNEIRTHYELAIVSVEFLVVTRYRVTGVSSLYGYVRPYKVPTLTAVGHDHQSPYLTRPLGRPLIL